MFNNIFAAMARKDRMTINQLSREVGISPKSMSNKLHGRTEFTRAEMVKIQNVFDGIPLDTLFAKTPSNN